MVLEFYLPILRNALNFTLVNTPNLNEPEMCALANFTRYLENQVLSPTIYNSKGEPLHARLNKLSFKFLN